MTTNKAKQLRPKISLGATDPKTKKGREENARFYRMTERLHRPSKRKIPMPEWAVEEAVSDARRQKRKGWKPLKTAYVDWPEARKAYLKAFDEK